VSGRSTKSRRRQLTSELHRLSKFEKSANKLVLNLNSVIVKPEHVEGRVPPLHSPVGPLADSTVVAKAAEAVTAPATYSHSPNAPASNPLLVPPTDIPKQRATKTEAPSSRLRKPQTAKKRITPAPTKDTYQSDDDDELALIVAPAPIPTVSTRKPKRSTAARPAPTKRQGLAKSLDDEATEVEPVAKKTGRSKASRTFLKQAEVEGVSSPKELSSEPPPPALELPKPRKKEPKTVRLE